MNSRTGKILLFAAAAAGLVASALHWYTFVNWIVVPYFLVIVLFALAADRDGAGRSDSGASFLRPVEPA